MNSYNIIFLFLVLFNSMNALAQTRIKKIKLAHSTTCIINENDQLKCWGGQSIKPGSYTEPNSSPELIDVFPSVAEIEIGGAYSCAISTKGEVKCWGLAHEVPFLVKLPSPAKAVTACGDTICILLTDGDVRCFDLGQGSNNLALAVSLPSAADQIASNYISITVHLVDGSIWRWGAQERKPAKLKGLGNVKRLFGGDTKFCYIMDSGEVKCEFNHEIYSTIKGLESNVHDGVTHEDSGCGVLVNGQVKCWGFNGDGKIGLPESVDRSAEAVLITGVTNAIGADMANGISCAQLKNDIVKCWGSGFKILGTGSETHLSAYELKIQ